MREPGKHLLHAHLASDNVRTIVAYDPDVLDELSEAFGLCPNSHLEAGHPHPHEELADPHQHTFVSHAIGSNRSELHHNVKSPALRRVIDPLRA